MTEVVQTEDVLGGEPRVDGTRIGVLDIHDLVVAGGSTPADVADQLDCSLAAVYTALAYYYEHPEEMRTLKREQKRLNDRLEDRALSRPPHEPSDHPRAKMQRQNGG